MAINFVRKPSETPNVRNIDDIIAFRYAYGNQNGYVKDKGNELSYTINGSNFRINSGRVVLQGVESDIDANGVTITVQNTGTTTYYVVYYHVNLATNTTSIESESEDNDYPTISIGDDLTSNTSGSANLVLYKFTALNGIISNVTKVVQQVKYTQDIVVNNSSNANGVTLNRSSNSKIKDDVSRTLFGFENTNNELFIGNSNYELKLQGSQERPIYNTTYLSLKTDTDKKVSGPGTSEISLGSNVGGYTPTESGFIIANASGFADNSYARILVHTGTSFLSYRCLASNLYPEGTSRGYNPCSTLICPVCKGITYELQSSSHYTFYFLRNGG